MLSQHKEILTDYIIVYFQNTSETFINELLQMHKIHPGFPYPKKVNYEKHQADDNNIISGVAVSESVIQSKYDG